MKGKIIVITGASSGIGALMAVLVAEQGAIPVLMARSLDKLEEIERNINGPKMVMQVDVTSSEQVIRAMEQVMTSYDRIDILINNAGFGVFTEFMDTPLAQFEEMMDVNYMGTVRCTHAVLPHMLEAGAGHIINVASLAGKIGTAKATGYAATKHAVLGFTNSLRQELAGTGVMISAVNPGPIDTPFFTKADPSGNYLRNLQRFVLRPEYVAKVVLSVIKYKKEEIDLPRMANIGVKLVQLFPRISYKLAGRWMNRK